MLQNSTRIWNFFPITVNFGTFECRDEIQISVYAYVHICANKGSHPSIQTAMA